MSSAESRPGAGGREAAGPRPVRAAAHDGVDVAMTVNGTPVELHVPARLTLLDALRERLGLTGTHTGCEHGVCGMCTVLVDGDAARACLLLACQLDGAEVVTVEGLGRPDDLHPLQAAFGRNHALQCGFCTPGFLMSSYDLLSHEPAVAEEDLPEQLSGVLCRCTGYRNIVTAVAETARAYPGGPPAPGNCAKRVLTGRGGPGAGAPAGAGGERVPAAEAGAEDVAIRLPDAEPTVTVDLTSELAVDEDRLWRVLDDVHTLARCLPGAELTEELGPDRYAGRARVAVGPVKLSFTGVAHVLERDRERGRVHVVAQGQDTGGARTQGDVVLTLDRADGGLTLRAAADVYLTGRIAQFGRALAGDISRRMFEQFAESLEQAAAAGAAPVRPGAAPSALGLMAHALRRRVRAFFARITGRGEEGGRR
ncbi:2Fe-2S iron-sulfur cluster-binding protein [Streptomonospora arabica]|uniref:2Fe-2S iron-sulfur cluster-binding protein n=1 Tax=Streptomonospora arabica TaxID=412417 RepID=A0ABV9SGE1_9ACTN